MYLFTDFTGGNKILSWKLSRNKVASNFLKYLRDKKIIIKILTIKHIHIKSIKTIIHRKKIYKIHIY